MELIEVLIESQVRTFVRNLPFTLINGGYFSTFEKAKAYTLELVNFIYSVPHLPSYKLSRKALRHYKRYGSLLRYAFYRRGRTTWYIFFEQLGTRYIVHHISNNWTEGQYVR